MDSEHFKKPVGEFARKDFPLLLSDMTVREALEVIRAQGIGERIVYFYVVDGQERLSGVLPTRQLLTAPLERRLEDAMNRRVVAIPHSATLLDACDVFILHKFLAFPVVDELRRVVGMVDIGLFASEVLGMDEPEKTDEVFEALGFRVSQVRGASPWKAFTYRFPWLLSTIGSGTIGALLAGVFEETLERAIVVSFFLALVLALAESVSIQSMTLTLQALRGTQTGLRWFLIALRRELALALLLGVACGAVVFGIVWGWRGQLGAAGVVGGSVAGSVVIACLAGLGVPSVLHALKWDPKIAAGPVTLGCTDVFTLLLYFSLARWLL
jgi:magnesium transporter